MSLNFCVHTKRPSIFTKRQSSEITVLKLYEFLMSIVMIPHFDQYVLKCKFQTLSLNRNIGF